MVSQYELLTAARQRKINEQLTLIDSEARKMSGDMEKRIASLGYINADFSSGMALLSSVLGFVSLAIAIFTTEIEFGLKIVLGVFAVVLLGVAGGATWKFFTKDTAKQVAFGIHQQRCAEESRVLISAGIEELRNREVIRANESQVNELNVVRPSKDLNTKLWLSLLLVLAITARKKR